MVWREPKAVKQLIDDAIVRDYLRSQGLLHTGPIEMKPINLGGTRDDDRPEERSE